VGLERLPAIPKSQIESRAGAGQPQEELRLQSRANVEKFLRK